MTVAALLWAAGYGAYGLICVLAGQPMFWLGPDSLPVALNWYAVAVAILASIGVAITVRFGTNRFRRALLWTTSALCVVPAFSLLMDVVTLIFDQDVGNPVAAVNHVLGMLGVVLLAVMALSSRPVQMAPGPPPVSGPVPAPRAVRLAAYAGTVAFVPYIWMKLTWALGGTFAGVSGAEMQATSQRNGASGLWHALESVGLDPTVLLALVGIFLIHGLVHRWGQVFPRWSLLLYGRKVPRWLPLTPALIGVLTLAPYGTIGLGYLALAEAGVVTMRSGDFPDAMLVGWIGMVAFAGYGIALAVATRSYWLRTRHPHV